MMRQVRNTSHKGVEHRRRAYAVARRRGDTSACYVVAGRRCSTQPNRLLFGQLRLFSSMPDLDKTTLHNRSGAHADTLADLAGKAAEPWHRTESGGYLRNVVYGFNDGLTANFRLVAGVLGAAAAPHIVLVSGIAGMIADALSMGASGYLAAKSEQEVYAHEIAMEKEEIRLMPDVEQDELALVYQAKGIEPGIARQMVVGLGVAGVGSVVGDIVAKIF